MFVAPVFIWVLNETGTSKHYNTAVSGLLSTSQEDYWGHLVLQTPRRLEGCKKHPFSSKLSQTVL